MTEQKPLKKVTLATAQEALGKIDNLIDQARNDGAPYSVDDALDVLRSYRIGPHTQYAGRGRTIVKLVIDYGPWDYEGPKGQAPYLELIQALIDAGADVDAQDKYGLSLLHHAVDSQAWAVCELLLQAGATADSLDNDGQTPLDYAIYYHRYHLNYTGPAEEFARCVEALILGGADVYRRYEEPKHWRLEDRESPFDWISALPEDAPQRKTFFDALAKRYTLQQTSQESETPNAQPSIRKEKAMTPKPKMRTKTTLKTALKILHERVYPLASEDKFDEAVEALIASGLEPNTVYASKNRRLFKLLIDGEDWFKNNRQHRRFLEKALDFGCDVDWQDDYGNTYLHYATYRYRPDLIRLLLERGANPNLPEKLHGGVPLYEALSSFALHERARSAQCVEALILGGADIYFCLRGNLTIFDWMNNLPVPCGSKKYDLAKKTFFDALAKRDALQQTPQDPETTNA